MRLALYGLILMLLLGGCAPQAAAGPTTPPPPIPTQTPVSPPPITPGADILLLDDFTELSAERWAVWGRPEPMIQRGAEVSYLVLTGIEPRYESGLTSRVEIPFLPDTAIRLSAHVPPEWQGRDAWLVLDWDPRPAVESARIQEGAVIRLLLLPGSVTLYTRETDLECNVQVNTDQPHTYTLLLRDIFEVTLWIDQADEPVCRHDYTDHIYEIARTGPITLTGAGWVTRIEAGQ